MLKVAGGKLKGVPPQKWGAAMKHWDPKTDFSYALLHAERLTKYDVAEEIDESEYDAELDGEIVDGGARASPSRFLATISMTWHGFVTVDEKGTPCAGVSLCKTGPALERWREHASPERRGCV